ncbi:hypothetical protein C0V75_15225 [Tabrizicola sp. TH137]|uniref:hypothetical protein n=1 Tax=Tabrizicola sp. TH137 TaxID=2067452 RepID=UPI000C7D83BC|nr:hypothetical protein [Tabrizicola sp. TH137]PLL11385.1 hypothetical protein C0V75_15225 [Tabrizicola sp. TH137]
MAFPPEHEIHRRRFGRNIGVAVTLALFIVLVFALTVVKVTRGDPMQAFDHSVRPELAAEEAE